MLTLAGKNDSGSEERFTLRFDEMNQSASTLHLILSPGRFLPITAKTLVLKPVSNDPSIFVSAGIVDFRFMKAKVIGIVKPWYKPLDPKVLEQFIKKDQVTIILSQQDFLRPQFSCDGPLVVIDQNENLQVYVNQGVDADIEVSLPFRQGLETSWVEMIRGHFKSGLLLSATRMLRSMWQLKAFKSLFIEKNGSRKSALLLCLLCRALGEPVVLTNERELHQDPYFRIILANLGYDKVRALSLTITNTFKGEGICQMSQLQQAIPEEIVETLIDELCTGSPLIPRMSNKPQ